METSFTSRRQATQAVPQFTISLPPPAEIPSTRYPNHAPTILSPPRYSNSDVGPREATAAASTAATPTTTSSSSYAVLPSSPSIAQTPASLSASSVTSSNTKNTSTFQPPLHSSTSRDPTIKSSVLTPKSGIASEGLTPSPGGNSGSSQSSQPGGGGSGLYYQPMPGPWQQSGSTHTPSYTYTAAVNHNSATSSSSVVPQPFAPRQSLYGGVSPSIPQFAARTSSTSTNGENLPNPPSYPEQSPFSTPISTGAGSLGSNYSQAPGTATHTVLSQPILSSQSSNTAQPPTPTHQTANSGAGQPGHDGPSYRPPPAPSNYYPPTSTPQQSSYPSFPGPPHHSPTTHSPTTTRASSRGLGALAGGMAPPLQYGSGRIPSVGSYHSPYQMPSGPVLSNVHHPGTPLSMVGGMHGLHHYNIPHGHHLYGTHNGPPPGDRPFKCDECPQSFNRNHDLKRHKRIHLAVKPFPCTHCDKSFSRKDALKVS